MTVLGIGERHFQRAVTAAQRKEKPGPRHDWSIPKALVFAPLMLGLLIEGALMLRFWAQVTDQNVTGGLLALVFDATNFLVSPFRGFEPERPIKETGIVEIATLVAAQVYFVAAVAGSIALGALRGVTEAWMRHRRRRALAAKPH